MAAKYNKRRAQDVMKLMMSNYDVRMASDDSLEEFYVHFEGPKESPYEGGHWNIHVCLPEEYPYKSPSIGFCNAIFHPNVDESSGSVCLDVINQTWSPMFDLRNVFDVFLPQLLLYPNAADPLNQDAAALHMADPDAYRERVKSYVQEYAQLCMFDEEPSRSRGSTFTRASSTAEESNMSLASGPPSANEDEVTLETDEVNDSAFSDRHSSSAAPPIQELEHPKLDGAVCSSDSDSGDEDAEDEGDEFSDIDDSDGEL